MQQQQNAPADAMCRTARMILLAGPPGVGKTSLGRETCWRLGLRFLELSAQVGITAEQSPTAQHAFERALAERTADVIELPWDLQLDAAVRKHCRQVGALVGLWAHPLDMQARSGRTEPLFTLRRNFTTGGGFGRTGTSCLEFRLLNRGCEIMLALLNCTLEEAQPLLEKTIAKLRQPIGGSIAVQEEVDGWVDGWQRDMRVDRRAAELLVEAVARFVRELREQGASPRSLSGVINDLHMLGWLNFNYDRPRGEQIFERLGNYEYEFDRKCACSAGESHRYRGTCERFRRFLVREGLLLED